MKFRKGLYIRRGGIRPWQLLLLELGSGNAEGKRVHYGLECRQIYVPSVSAIDIFFLKREVARETPESRSQGQKNLLVNSLGISVRLISASTRIKCRTVCRAIYQNRGLISQVRLESGYIRRG